MRKPFLFIIILGISLQLSGQIYHSLNYQKAKWCIQYNNHEIPPPFWWYTNYWETAYSGDTIINNKNYIKVSRTEYDIFCLNTVLNGPDYIGSIRDDTIQKQVFYVPKTETEEKLIYDFNLGIGDTLFSYLNFYEPLIVEQVDSIIISQTYHKRIQFQYNEAEIIEGLGSTTGLLEELIAFEGGSYLCAFYIDTTFTYPESPCNLSATDSCSTLSTEPNIKFSDIEIFPNPAKDKVQIKISNDLLLNHPKLELSSISGKILINQSLTNEITKFYLNDLISGIYIVNIISDNKTILNKKLIVRD